MNFEKHFVTLLNLRAFDLLHAKSFDYQSVLVDFCILCHVYWALRKQFSFYSGNWINSFILVTN